MLTHEENETITRVGPGAPGGELLCRYWHPIAVAQEITDESPTKFVRVLGEDLVIFRDKSGRTGLIADKCAHRSASLVWRAEYQRAQASTGQTWAPPRDAR